MKCPLCQNEAKLSVDKVKDFFILKGKSADFSVYYCPACEIAFSFPIFSDKELASSYPNDYEAYQKKKFFKGFIQTLKYQSDLHVIKNKIDGKKCSFFEIGAGRGEFLSEAKKEGFEVGGLEPGKAGCDSARHLYQIELDCGYANDLKINHKYDVFVARHVLEHLGDPVSVLKKISLSLNNGGLLFLKLPRLDSWEAKLFKKYWSGYDLPRHRFHYSKNGIKCLLEKTGFGSVQIISECVPSDIMRSIKYYSIMEVDLLSRSFRLFLNLPEIIQMILAQIISLALLPFGSGRMIVIARK